MWTDLWGNALPNPFQTGDLKGQSLLTQHDPPLAAWLKKFATTNFPRYGRGGGVGRVSVSE